MTWAETLNCDIGQRTVRFENDKYMFMFIFREWKLSYTRWIQCTVMYMYQEYQSCYLIIYNYLCLSLCIWWCSFRMLEVDIGRRVYPQYEVDVTRPLFESSEEFTRSVSGRLKHDSNEGWLIEVVTWMLFHNNIHPYSTPLSPFSRSTQLRINLRVHEIINYSWCNCWHW